MPTIKPGQSVALAGKRYTLCSLHTANGVRMATIKRPYEPCRYVKAARLVVIGGSHASNDGTRAAANGNDPAAD